MTNYSFYAPSSACRSIVIAPTTPAPSSGSQKDAVTTPIMHSLSRDSSDSNSSSAVNVNVPIPTSATREEEEDNAEEEEMRMLREQNMKLSAWCVIIPNTHSLYILFALFAFVCCNTMRCSTKRVSLICEPGIGSGAVVCYTLLSRYSHVHDIFV